MCYKLLNIDISYFYYFLLPRGGELSSFKDPGVGNLLHSCKKNTNPEGIAWGGMVTAGIDHA